MDKPSAPLISIVVLNHNGMAYLPRTIPSLLALTYRPLEIVVVDNGSTDGSVAFLERHARLRLVRSAENVGTSRGRNLGAAAATGDRILFLDNDVLVPAADLLEEVSAVFEQLDAPGFLNVVLIDQEDLADRRTYYYGGWYVPYGIRYNPKVPFERLQRHPWFRTAVSFTGTVFVDRAVWHELGGFDESQPYNVDDDDISLRATIYGFKNYTTTVRHCVHLGRSRKIDNADLAWKHRYFFAGKAKPILKYFRPRTIARVFPLFASMAVTKTAVLAATRRCPQLFGSLLYSAGLLLRDAPDIIAQRRIHQARRRVDDAAVFAIRRPDAFR